MSNSRQIHLRYIHPPEILSHVGIEAKSSSVELAISRNRLSIRILLYCILLQLLAIIERATHGEVLGLSSLQCV